MEYSPWGKVKAIKILDRERQKGKDAKFLVYYDPDIDGLSAGYLAQKFLTKLGVTSRYCINQNREHGFTLTLEQIKEYVGHLIIAVDFAMTYAEVKTLVDAGISIIVMDHHHIQAEKIYVVNEDTGAKGIVINNQYPSEPEKYRFLSGAGVVYCTQKYFYEAYKIYDEQENKDNMALVGVSLFSDIRPTESKEAQEFIDETFTNNSEQFKWLIDVTTRYDSPDRSRFESFGVPSMNRNFIDYQLSPKFNALLRLNEGVLAVRVFKGDKESIAMLKENDLIGQKKAMQAGIVEELMKVLRGAEMSNLIAKGVPAAYKSIYPCNVSNFIGLVCSRIRGESKTTFLFVEDERPGHIKRGSVRGLYDGVDYLQIFKDHGFDCEGHMMAFGVRDTDLNKVNWASLNQAIAEAEIEGRQKLRQNQRIIQVNNLSVFLSGRNKEYARYNTYVRDSYRYYIKYTGDDIKEVRKKKVVEYIIDGIPITCFDMNLDPREGLILPVWGRGEYIEFTMRRPVMY